MLIETFSEERDQQKFQVRAALKNRAPDGDGLFWFAATAPRVNRYGSFVVASGIQTGDFANNPLFGWNHRLYEDAEIDTVIGRVERWVQTDERFDVGVRYVPPEIHPNGARVQAMVEGGWLNAVSMGFYGTKGSMREVDGEQAFVYDESELLEVSQVALPANPSALAIEAPPALYGAADAGAVQDALAASVAEWCNTTMRRRYTNE